MTDKEILQKVFYKTDNKQYDVTITKEYLATNKETLFIELYLPYKGCVDSFDLYALIFSHSFAKAFWGEEEIGNVEFTKRNERQSEYSEILLAWQYHLQQMVLEENPLKYLERFL